MRKLVLTLAAIGLAAAPIAAQSDDTTAGTEDSTLVSAAPIILFALAAVAVGIFVGGDDDSPISA